jgi:GTPase
MAFKSGFVNIIGMPNAGKSTLMNTLLGEKLSIVTPKVQTTRHRIIGVVTGDDYQIVYSDTPGILQPKYKLQERMLSFVETALDDADVLIYLIDINEPFELNSGYVERLKQKDQPLILALNKIDRIAAENLDALVAKWQGLAGEKARVITLSALMNANTHQLVDAIISLLPEGEPYYPADTFTNRTERFLVEETIREKILMCYRQEIPYSVEVKVESFKEEEKILRISAVLYVERESQKIIIIGNKGAAIKKVGIEARKDLEEAFRKQVFLQLFVKVRKDWRNNDRQLEAFGYNL